MPLPPARLDRRPSAAARLLGHPARGRLLSIGSRIVLGAMGQWPHVQLRRTGSDEPHGVSGYLIKRELALASRLTLLLAATSALGGGVQQQLARQIQASNSSGSHSLDVTNCPGYTLSALKETPNGLTASLALAGPACNAFGQDIANLTIQVIYETESRLHMHIFDTAHTGDVKPPGIQVSTH
ncbi:hypothetical protein FB45DRAFT_1066370 [Roridomyces roridus]|uniref:Uncharacterized protein n=1 Tax=Roridomyces roridus TaxID=1738132 RepID=A0AAD7B5A0_9AGAR|nr:hypothetical protein FB45DRAFT_1066370 [Roridomyces roridus]